MADKNAVTVKNKKQSTIFSDLYPAILTDKTGFQAKEAYKATRTNLLFILNKSENRQVVITSPYMEAGKTTTCINLAITFAQLGSKVLIIDADMRKPMVNKAFSLPLSPGLADRLGGFTEELNIIKTSYENLYILPAGTIPPNPTELLTSSMLNTVLTDCSENFDYVFVDAPPINVVTDAAIIGGKVAGTVLVVRQDVTTRDSLMSAVKSLTQVESHLLGFILNAVDQDKYSYRYGHYYGRYGSYYNKYYHKYGYGKYGYGKYGYGKRGDYMRYEADTYGYSSEPDQQANPEEVESVPKDNENSKAKSK